MYIHLLFFLSKQDCVASLERDSGKRTPCMIPIRLIHDSGRIVYVIAGRSKWIVGNEERDAVAGDVLVVRAGEPHKFVSAEDDPVRQIDIHLNPTFQTVWLE